MSYRLARLLRTDLERRIHAIEPSPVLKPGDFPWAREVEAFYPAIRADALKVLERIDSIANFDEVLPGQRALYQKESWKSFFLVCLKEDISSHQRACPATTEALRRVPGLINAFFSILKPGVQIPAHRGPYAGVLRYHLGVVIPKGDVAIRVADEVCRWTEGGSLFFDDSFEHEAWNRTDETRVILFVDFERPLPTRVLTTYNRALMKAFEFSGAARTAFKAVQATQLNF